MREARRGNSAGLHRRCASRNDSLFIKGRWYQAGLRVTVSTVLGLFATGASREEILRSYPFLESADIDACLAYAAWRAQEYEAPLAPVA